MNYTKNGSLLKKQQTVSIPEKKEVEAFLIALQEDLSTYPEILKTKTVAEILQVNQRTVLNYINLNWLVGNGISTRNIKVLKTDLINFIASRRFPDVFDREIPKFKIIKKNKSNLKDSSLFG